MAKVKVYSRLPKSFKFTFQHYVGEGAQMELTPEDPNLTIIINGTEEILNHTLVVKEGAATIFGYAEHNIKEGRYTLDDLERLKANPNFKKFVKNGDMSIDCLDDLSRDFTGVGKLSDKELAERANKSSGGENDALRLAGA